jgi:NAD(P)-dependent dehydrogenase (short-subunit alcohol dehydrogenase family)
MSSGGAADPELQFHGRTVLVTGSGRNIGRAIVLEFAGRGANVVINARSNRDEAEEVRREAERLGARALVVMGDAGRPEVVAELKARSEAAFGRVDIYVSNAAKRLSKTFFETTDEDWDLHLNQQLTASWRLAKAFTPAMCEARWGRIIHMNGPDGYRGGWDRVPHSTAKGGLRTLTKSLAAGLGEFGVTVNDINPGYTETIRDPTTHPKFHQPGFSEKLAASIPIRRATTVEEIAFACVFLCSPRAGAITGSVLHVDGGKDMLG